MSYATLQQLTDYLHGAGSSTGLLPADAARLLERASELVQDSTITAVYSADSLGNPTHTATQTAFANAVSAQVEYWLAGDEEDDVMGPLQGASVGSQQQQYGAGANRATPMYLAPRAARHLRLGGLMNNVVSDGSTGYTPEYGDPLAEYQAGLGG